MRIIFTLTILAMTGCSTAGAHLSHQKEGWFNYSVSTAVGGHASELAYCTAENKKQPKCFPAELVETGQRKNHQDIRRRPHQRRRR